MSEQTERPITPCTQCGGTTVHSLGCWMAPGKREPVTHPVIEPQTEADRLLAEVRMAGIALHAAQDRLSRAQQDLRGYLAHPDSPRPSDRATAALPPAAFAQVQEALRPPEADQADHG